MPIVPFTQRQGQAQSLPKADPTFLMMAAAELHEAGRLIEPEPFFIPTQRDQPEVSTTHPDFDRQNEEYQTGKDIENSNRAVKLSPESI